MATNPTAQIDAEQILRVLHGQLKRKREGINRVVEQIAVFASSGAISEVVAKGLTDELRALVRHEDELTQAERDILYRDAKLEQCLRHQFPAMPDHLMVVAICIVDGLSTAQIAAIVFKSTKAVDHYRQEIRQIMGLQGDRSSLHRHLTSVVQNCTICNQ
ncbi:MAG: hypothetical protein FGM32_11775 [Candidatus Kapabacteria bacterium]|nr:hypothetical protein [Candidatus Kapabacteria bacterium]